MLALQVDTGREQSGAHLFRLALASLWLLCRTVDGVSKTKERHTSGHPGATPPPIRKDELPPSPPDIDKTWHKGIL